MSAPYPASVQYQEQQQYYPITPNQNNTDFQNNQPYMMPPNQTNQNYIETPQNNNTQNYVIDSYSPYNAQVFNNGELTNKRNIFQICIYVILYIISLLSLFDSLYIFSHIRFISFLV